WVIEHAPVVKPGWPTTRAACSPFVKVGVNSSTLLLAPSATQRFPDLSKASVTGKESPPRLVALAFVIKEDWPITSEADSPVEKGALNLSTLLFPSSATQRFPDLSNAMPVGVVNPLMVVAPVLVVKEDCPITIEANSPLERGARNSNTLLFLASATHRF